MDGERRGKLASFVLLPAIIVAVGIVAYFTFRTTLALDRLRQEAVVEATLGLALLYVGLKRHRRTLRVAGLAFFPISLAKIFLFDLPALSSITRALSFLAVGAVLLLGGFFYQRLMSDRDERPPAVTSPPA